MSVNPRRGVGVRRRRGRNDRRDGGLDDSDRDLPATSGVVLGHPVLERLEIGAGLHGFLQGPAIGEILRDMYLGKTPFVDITPLSNDRFSSGGELRPEKNIV